MTSNFKKDALLLWIAGGVGDLPAWPKKIG